MVKKPLTKNTYIKLGYKDTFISRGTIKILVYFIFVTYYLTCILQKFT
jgi:hypothetical protein